MNKIALLVAAALIAAPALADEANPMTGPAQDTAAPAAQPADASAGEPSTEPAAAPKPAGTVARAAFSTDIENREPVDKVSTLENDKHKIYYFTELKDMAGATVTHRWEHGGKVMAEVPFKVGGNRWRVYSSKQLEGDWTGQWKVSVVDQSGATLAVNTFDYVKAPEPAAPAEAAPDAAPASEAPAQDQAPAVPQQ
jgi:hypothetical protein